MSALQSVLVVLILALSTMAQKDGARATSGGSSRQLQPWLIGLTAMVVFLFIVFTLMIANRLFCKKRKDEFEEVKNERMEANAYENSALDIEEGGKIKPMGKWDEKDENNEAQKVTEM
ncbi:Hypothetical predicted protein [Pelobates cultripes]|uniref:Small integral membrane protein 24 n=1 Tax=Pelobates cultripes TaxID=61616 RepID=A0AAD1S3Z0_PELCU|nr:Hypothetical predicted protein [Pelobates cultripes]